MAISEPLQGANSNPSTSSAEDTRANLFPRPENAPEPQTSAIFGLSLRDSLAYYDPDTCCWKTFQATFLSDLETYSETWPDSGLMRNGVVTELRTSAPVTSESESSSWPTATSNMVTGAGTDGRDGGENLQTTVSRWPTVRSTSGGGNRSGYEGAPYRPAIAQQAAAQNWPTARREDGESCGNHPGAVDSLTGATRTWKTPHGLSPKGQNGKVGGCGGGEFGKQANNWATPASHERAQDPRQVDHGAQLANQADIWQTPQARDHRSGESLRDYGNARPLNEQVLEFSLPALQIPNGQPSSNPDQTSRRLFPTPSASMATVQDLEQASYAGNDPNRPKYADLEKRRLNPRFVCWLMGFPIGWTEVD